jgi:hypothetical protein
VIAVLLVGDAGLCIADEDFMAWTSLDFRWEVNEDWRLSFEEAWRFNDDASNFYYEHSDIGILYRGLADWIDIGLNYRAIYDRDDNDWVEGRPHLNVDLNGKLFGIEFQDRSRLEYRAMDGDGDVWRYRNKFTINRPFEHLPERIRERARGRVRPYVADEIFINFEGQALDKNRVFVGLSIRASEHIICDIHYFWQTRGADGEWEGDAHVIGTNLKIVF